MTDLTHNDLHRDIGRMEGRFDAVEDRLSKLENSVEQIREGVEFLKTKESERKGIWWALAMFAGSVGWASGIIISHFWK